MKTPDEGWRIGRKLVHTGDWNHYEILAQGRRIRLKLNGTVTIGTADDQAASGRSRCKPARPCGWSSAISTEAPAMTSRARIIDCAGIHGVRCPWGTARRALQDAPELPGTVHVTEISEDAALHYHPRLTETCYFLECGPDARMQLDQECVRFSRVGAS